MSNEEQLHLVGHTARWTAAVRAVESARADRLFHDPYAGELAGEEGLKWAGSRTDDSLAPIVLRTRYYDDQLACLRKEARIRQVVLLAAGLDTRAFRLDWAPGAVVFEVDQPQVLDYKENALRAAAAEARCERRVVKADLTREWVSGLVEAGYDQRQPSGWLLEGFLFYLPTETGAHILDEVTRLAAPASWLGFDVINSEMLTSPFSRKWVEMQAALGAPWIGTMDDPARLMASRNWQATMTQAGAEDANHGRWPYPVIPVNMPNVPHNWFVTAVRK